VAKATTRYASHGRPTSASLDDAELKGRAGFAGAAVRRCPLEFSTFVNAVEFSKTDALQTA
jgi:hypothetical protein